MSARGGNIKLRSRLDRREGVKPSPTGDEVYPGPVLSTTSYKSTTSAFNADAHGTVGLRAELPMAGMSYRGSEMRKSCVLLAQGNPVNQEVGRTMIEALGCRVEVASNGCEVLNRMESGWYDVVLMDCRMPVMDGLAAARAIRSREKRQGGPRTAIIAVAGNFSDEDRSRCLDAGMDDCLVKPFYMPELSAMITKWCNRFIWS